MKTIIHLIAMVLMVAVLASCQQNNKHVDNKELDYNVKTSTFVDSLFKTNPIFTEVSKYDDRTCYTIRFDECEFFVVYKPSIPYAQKEEWLYFGTYKNADIIMIQSSFNNKKHLIKPELYTMIQNYCKSIKE